MVTFLPFGDDAVLVEVADTDAVIALAAALTTPPRGVLECVSAARTVLITFNPTLISAESVRTWVRRARPSATTTRSADEITIDVRYDGDDLTDAATELGVSVEHLVAAHRSARWTVAFTGFAPGFGYLTSPEWTYHLPRRAMPRTRVPAGAVAVADEFCGIYPRPTPGGWQLIGTTDAVLFDLDRPAPALLTPGTCVHFREMP